MDYLQKQELVRRVEEEYGIDNLFKDLGFEHVSKRGGNIYSVCPFHKGADNPNGFAYSNSFGFCFTNCHEKLDLYSIVMKALPCEFTDAVQYLADKVGMQVDLSGSSQLFSDSSVNREFLGQVRRLKSKKKAVEINPIDSKVFNDIEPYLHKMLREEGFDNETREYFGLGFARAGYFENRITIPVDYINGDILTISGRSVLPKEQLETKGLRRYLLYFETDKAITLYNISRALPYIEIMREVIVVEGFKSVWRLHQWGIRNVVAVMGNSMSDEQRKLLLKLGCRIVVCGDRDEAGTKLNHQVQHELNNLADVEVMDMFLLNVPGKSSIDDITKEQYE